MNITFLIGNGFDINIGLKTRYTDFYPYFIEKANDDNIIKSWINPNDSNWADLEKSLGMHLSKLKGDELAKFISDKNELDELLMEYLEREQSKYVIDSPEMTMNLHET